MSSKPLFTVLAGRSKDFFSIGGIDFEAAPLSLLEYGEMMALPDGLDAKAEFLAEKLRKRLRRGTDDPALITTDWVMENVPLSMVRTLDHVLLYGELPTEGDSGKR